MAEAAQEDELKKQIDQIAGEYLAEKGSVGLAVGVISGGQQRIFCYGERAQGSDAPVDPDSLFEIASITKTFTTTLLAEMAQRGEVRLKDPLQKYLPEGATAPKYRGREIDLVHLATHLSGLPGAPPNITWADDGDPWGRYTEEELYQAVRSTKLRTAPGTRGAYSNYGMGLLGNALGRIHGGGYEAAVVERICEPLGMPDTRITLTVEQEARFVQGHAKGEPTPHWTTPALPGCGAIRSSVRDMLRYVAANLGEAPSPLREGMEECRRSRGKASPPRPTGQRMLFALAFAAVSLFLHWRVAPPLGPPSDNFWLLFWPVALSAWFGGTSAGAAAAVLLAAADLIFRILPNPGFPGNALSALRSPAVMVVLGTGIGWVIGTGHRAAAREEVGLGWFSSPLDRGARTWWHNGMTGGFSTFAGFVTESGSGIVVLSNSNNSVDYTADRMLRAVHGAHRKPATGGSP